MILTQEGYSDGERFNFSRLVRGHMSRSGRGLPGSLDLICGPLDCKLRSRPAIERRYWNRPLKPRQYKPAGARSYAARRFCPSKYFKITAADSLGPFRFVYATLMDRATCR